ncbi:error-prone DNA polymerase [Advenella mimigardefordensis]|uniref:Error-prone DNA polymerase n=1 Tax=Advenella mimigardefordensis (strain DSM 17166 / LMG 22922 / DPN7) TaxID=1247726 RepID=W0PGN5_ADVMD|nr:error-prone DNA polymerase [Advenella mimigardefordensis]AHG64872.1 error-prone DNA polymerase [Advenella mimigardefordensis DPN7]
MTIPSSSRSSSYALPGYAELYCQSNYSFLQGASHPEELAQQAFQLNYMALAITDECSVAGVVRAHAEVEKLNKPILEEMERRKKAALEKAGYAPGQSDPAQAVSSLRPLPAWLSQLLRAPASPLSHLPVVPAESVSASISTENAASSAVPPVELPRDLPMKLIVGSVFSLHADDHAPALKLIVLAKSRDGYGNLCEFITLGRRRAAKGSYYLTPSDITRPADPALAHLQNLPECLGLLVPEYGASYEQMLRQAQWLEQAFAGRCWLALTLLHQGQDAAHRTRLMAVSAATGVPVVATGQVQMHVRSRKPVHDTLTAIRLGKSVQECGFARAANAECHLRQVVALANLYPPAALEQTLEVAVQCQFNLSELKYEYPDNICPENLTPTAYLRQETYAGAQRRFQDGIPDSVVRQLEYELQLIAELKYEAYFLTVYDIVKFARDQDILCQGRGSAANSAVCYCLHITEVSPLLGNNLFERFISKERNEPPDIDVDFEHQRREEVIQYIYDKYGRDRAALTAVVITYRVKSVLRDTGKALGVDPIIIEAVARSYHYWDGRANLMARMQECGLDLTSTVAIQWVALAEQIMGFPRHLSQHPGGFIMSRGPLARLVPIENAAMENRSVVQWDKDDLDVLGILKVDVLALGMLSVIRRALALVALRHNKPFFRIQDIPKEDDKTYNMICKADTIGVFQIESRAQMTMLPRLQPRCYYDLVIEVSIIRPGPIQGGMVHPYLRRRQGLEEIRYPTPEVESALKRTLGVPIFQEQVMQIAMKAAGFTGGEADDLRRSMAAWKRKGGLEKYYHKIVDGMVGKGYEKAFAEQIFRQIQGFGEYGFPESHAASFALLAYSSSWLKCHEPQAFLAALLNSQPMGFYSASTLIQDARRHDVKILPVDVQVSHWEATLAFAKSRSAAVSAADWAAEPVTEETTEHTGNPADHTSDGLSNKRKPNTAVRLGFNQLKGMQEAAAQRIVQARAHAPFTSVADLARRAGLSRHDLNALAAGNALESLAGHRRAALWDAVVSVPDKDMLREAPVYETESPQLTLLTEGQSIVADYDSLGLTLARHPLELLRDRLSKLRFSSSAFLQEQPDRRLVRAAGIVTVRQRPGTAKGVVFVTLEDEFGQINLLVRPELAERQRKELLTSRLMGAYGRWQSANGVQHVIVERLVNLTHLLGQLQTRSRNFH